MLIAVGLFLTSCSAPKKTAYHKPGNKSNTYKKPTPNSTPKNYERSEVGSRNADGYLKADGITDNKKLSSVVNEWLGVPHRMGGKDKSGIDCSGFTSVVLRSVYHKEIVGSSADITTSRGRPCIFQDWEHQSFTCRRLFIKWIFRSCHIKKGGFDIVFV